MKKNNIIQEKSYQFAIKIVNLYKNLVENQEFTLSRQLLKAGTSIGANIEEAQGSYSRKEFLAKLSIAYKEVRETKFWLRLLRDTNYISINEANLLLEECEELLRIVGSIQKSIKQQLRKE